MDTDPLPEPSPFISLLILLTRVIEFHVPPNWVGWSALVFIAFFCIGCSAFISGSEIAYFGLTHAETEELEENSSKAAKRALFMLERSQRLLATILIFNNLVNITMVVLLSYAFRQVITVYNGALDFLLQTVLLTFLLLVFGEIFPKLIARSYTLKWVMKASLPLEILFKLLGPFAKLMEQSTALVNKVVTKKHEQLSADDIEEALKISDLNEGEEKEMLEGILSLGDKHASDIMISRVDVTAIEYHDSWQNALKIILDSGYSRIPVYDTNQDTIKGILYAKDLIPYIDVKDDKFKWQNLLREAYFVPETRPIDDLMEDFRKKKIHIAIVIDEYGGTQGIVTLEDIIEEIVGEIDDEYDEQHSLYKKINDDTYIFDAKISLGDFADAMGIDESELGDTGEAETLAGLILELKGDFPNLSETFERAPFKFRVVQMEKHRIVKVKVTYLKEPKKTEEN